ncbi:MAG: type II toxin-antitoxin system PemK/MazF family toxin [Phyllobacteriaceae bacterium]|nr:type II toxin-antitoxin system PemK/MazF family toxin [Phyllobacteriaceae bacterium]
MVSGALPAASQFSIWLVNLDPTIGSEIKKTRPCLIVSPDEMNAWLRTIIIAPMTTARKSYASRVPIHFEDKDGEVALDQIRTIDRARLIRRLGRATEPTAQAVADTLVEMFAR